MLRKIIQYGDTLGKLFVFPPYEEAESWGQRVRVPVDNFVGEDGGWLPLGAKGLVEPLTMSKRFKLFSPELQDRWSNGCVCNCACAGNCKLREGWKTALVDYMYRGIMGGIQNLYVQMEDGSVRVSKAIVTNVSWDNSFESVFNEVSIEFTLPDPFFYDPDFNNTTFYDCIPFESLVCGCSKARGFFPRSLVHGCCFSGIANQCLYHGVILYEKDFGKTYPNLLPGTDAGLDLNRPATVMPSDNYEFDVCTSGSGGAGYISIKFSNCFHNPKITNLTNNTYINVTGDIADGEDVEIILNSFDDCGTLTCDITDSLVYSSAGGITADALSGSNKVFTLEPNFNTLKVQGVCRNDFSEVTINWLNKYY